MKIHIYQLLVRLFGNKNRNVRFDGNILENGCGKFNDLTAKALEEIKSLGFTHVWFTGILEHASQTEYPDLNIKADHPSIVKGKAGSPYAVRDYYNVCPDLAVNPVNRMQEFEQLIERTHKLGLKVIIDFVPNHVARSYKSTSKPNHVSDLGQNDNSNLAFSPQNNFYYLPGESFKVPSEQSVEELYHEFPAKVTGNDCFSASPSQNDWYETVKLNYGVDYLNGCAKHFDPIPDTWIKMTDILLYWAGKSVDGFRCDMAEMVPVEFWKYAIKRVKEKHPDILFIAEVYDPNQYRSYIFDGGFDLLYDKVGLYDTLRGIIEGHKWANDITNCWQSIGDIKDKMLCFLENHDEQRIASQFFASDPWRAIPALVVSCCMEKSSYMQYFGQEVGEDAAIAQGFSGDDGRTSIFDYCTVESHQNWMNDGVFDGGLLSENQKKLRLTYKTILNLALNNETIQKGYYYDLQWFNYDNENYNSRFVYSFLRYSKDEVLLFIVNFDNSTQTIKIRIPDDAFELTGCSYDSAGKILYSTSGFSSIVSFDQYFVIEANGILIVEFKIC
ncbi:MAG TPA: alpha-amylase family glycosyl hydrolase [Bacteroidales bacterium]|nr:alpha-amylase family glycosyl hydrolase [Bacteroidales bacterium]